MMKLGGRGLTRPALDELEEFLRALHRGRLRYPLRMSDRIGTGFPHIAEREEILQGLDERALRTVLVCIIAERREQRRRGKRCP